MSNQRGTNSKIVVALAVVIACMLAATVASATSPTGNGDGGVELTPIGNFDDPVFIGAAPGYPDLLFVVEQPGVIRVLRNGNLLPTPFLNIKGLVRDSGEQGLLSIAFDPHYRHNRRYYVYMTDNNGDNNIVEFKRQGGHPAHSKRSTRRQVLKIPHPNDAENHNGGQIAFGPDGRLYAAPGDGGSTPEAAQNKSNLRGKIIRINPHRTRKGKRYTVPHGNPYVGRNGRNEIYAVGLRNPFRFSFDSLTGAIAIGDVGESQREEIDFRNRGNARGVNFGWPRFEGDLLRDGGVSAPGPLVSPILDYGHSSRCAVIGGYVVRDPGLPTLYGRYVYGDLCDGVLRSLIPSQSGATDDGPIGGGIDDIGGMTSFGEGPGRHVYVAGGGGVYRLDPS